MAEEQKLLQTGYMVHTIKLEKEIYKILTMSVKNFLDLLDEEEANGTKIQSQKLKVLYHFFW
jgi:hypothetical protein